MLPRPTLHNKIGWAPLLVVLWLAAALASLGCSAAGGQEGSMNSPTGSVRFLGLKQGSTLSGKVDLATTISGSVRGVEFFVNDHKVDVLLEAPYELTLDTKEYPDGKATLAAGPLGGGPASRSEVSVTLDNTGPDIELTSPKPGNAWYGGGDVLLRFDISDAAGVRDVKVRANGITLPVQGPPWQASLNLAALSMTEDDLPLELAVQVEATDQFFVQSSKSYDFSLGPRLAWKHGTLGEIWAPPCFGQDGTAYFGSRDGKLYAVDPKGALLWSYDLGKEIVLSPAVDHASDGNIWVSAGDDVVVIDKLGKPTGIKWTAANTIGTSPVLGDEGVYVGTFGGQLVSLSRVNGSVRWTFQAGEGVESTPVLLGSGLLVFGSDDRYVHAVDALGQEKWKVETGGMVWSSAAATKSGDVLIGSHDGYLYRFDANGAKEWEFNARGQVWGAAAEGPGGEVYVGSTYRRLYRLDSKGEKKWERELSGLAYATPAVSSDGTVYIAATDGSVLALGPGGEILWTFMTGAELIGSARLSPDEKLVLVGANDRTMYAIRTDP